MGSEDETPTERKRKPRVQTSDDRALQHRHTSAVGIPVPSIEDDPADMTSPRDLFDPVRMDRHRRRGDSAMALAAKLRDERPDPYDLIAAMAFEFTDAKEQDRSANKELDIQFKAFLEQQPCGKEFDDLKRTVGLWRWIGSAVLVAALGSLGLGLSALWARAEHEGEIRVKIDRLQQDVQQLLRDERSSRHQTKDTAP